MDGRRLRKAIIAAAASTVETAKDLNKLRPEHILQTLKLAGERARLEEKAA
jgi:pachytene checkpoint protein 2